MALGDLAALHFVVRVGSNEYTINFGMKALTASATWRTQLAIEWDTQVAPTLISPMSDLATWIDTRVEDVVPGTGVDAFDIVSSVGGGLVAAPPVPPQCAGLIHWQTALPGRSHKGRSYVMGLPLPRLDSFSEQWDATGFAQLTAMKSRILDVYSRVSGTSSIAFLVIISRTTDGVAHAPDGVEVVNGVVVPAVRTLRRRQID